MFSHCIVFSRRVRMTVSAQFLCEWMHICVKQKRKKRNEPTIACNWVVRTFSYEQMRKTTVCFGCNLAYFVSMVRQDECDTMRTRHAKQSERSSNLCLLLFFLSLQIKALGRFLGGRHIVYCSMVGGESGLSWMGVRWCVTKLSFESDGNVCVYCMEWMILV